MSKRSHHKGTKGTKVHGVPTSEAFRFLVRDDRGDVIARFRRYDQAAECAGLQIARIACANSTIERHSITVEWRDDLSQRRVTMHLLVSASSVPSVVKGPESE